MKIPKPLFIVMANLIIAISISLLTTKTYSSGDLHTGGKLPPELQCSDIDFIRGNNESNNFLIVILDPFCTKCRQHINFINYLSRSSRLRICALVANRDIHTMQFQSQLSSQVTVRVVELERLRQQFRSLSIPFYVLIDMDMKIRAIGEAAIDSSRIIAEINVARSW